MLNIPYLNFLVKMQPTLFAGLLFSLSVLGVSPSAFASSDALNNVNVADTRKGYEIEITHQSPMQYLSHSPKSSGKKVRIQLRQSQNASTVQTQNEAIFSWAKAFDIPLEDITFDDLKSANPTLELTFTKHVKFTVTNAPDNRMTIVSLETPRPTFTGPEPVRDTTPRNLVTSLKTVDPNMSALLDRANKAMLDKEFGRAVQIFMRIREQGNTDIQPPIQELIGLTRESLGQLAHAQTEYQRYLTSFPEGDAAARVQQRLNVLKTAARELPTATRKTSQTNPNQWRKQLFGGFSQTYFYDQLDVDGAQTRTLRSALNNQLNITARASNSQYDFQATVAGVYQKDFEFDGEQDVINPHRITIEGRQKDWGLFARAGRQTRSSGGVLGRFDGVHAAYELNSIFTVNGVFGYPVDGQNQEYINVDQKFYGASVDIGSLWGGWEFTGFYINQRYLDFTDREAVGGEVRYIDNTKSLFTLVDYDIFFQELNIFMFNGRWAFTDQTSVNASMHHRRDPILFSYGAVQGQNVNYIEELFPKYTLPQLYTFAENRNSTINTGTVGIAHQINENWQLTGDVIATQYSGNDSSPDSYRGFPIEALEGTDTDLFYNARLVANNLLTDSDTVIFGLRYADTERAQTTSLDLNWRVNVTSKLRLNPQLRVDIRQSATNDDSRLQTRPRIRLDYKVRRSVRLELDMGFDWLSDDALNTTQQSTGLYFAAGYRVQF